MSSNRLLALVLIAALSAAFAQTPAKSPAPTPLPVPLAPETATLKVTTKLVAVSAIVRDNAGNPVTNLTRGSFLLKQDGKPQSIDYFSLGSSLPLTLALMVDTSGSQRAYIQDEIAASRVFFPAMLTRPDDRAVLVQFDSTILQLVKLTTNKTTLTHGLAYLTQPHDDIARPGRGGTLLYDAIVAVSHLELGNQFGRRAMVLLTDGGDNGSRFSKKDAIREAQRADIMIYTVYYSNGGGDEGVLRDLSRQTGGREFAVYPSGSLSQIFAAIASDLRQSYELGYRPPPSNPNKYHKIDLTTTAGKSLTVQARDGYFTPNNK
jgi:Ca-activated chloride channel family protein